MPTCPAPVPTLRKTQANNYKCTANFKKNQKKGWAKKAKPTKVNLNLIILRLQDIVINTITVYVE